MAVSRDVSLNIVAKVEEYQRELAKIPGTTDKQAARAAIAFGKRWQKGQTDAAKSAKKAASDSSRAWATVGTIITANLGTEAIKRAATAILGWRAALVESVDEVNTFAKQTGLSNETIAGMRFVADSTGKSLAQLVPPDLAKRILETSQGIGRAKRGFDGLEVSVVDSSGALKSSDVVLRETIDALQGVEHEGKRAGLAVQALGNQGALMLSSLQSSDSLDAFTDQAARLGVDVGPEAVRATAEWQASTAELSLAMEGLKESVARALDIESNIRNFTTGLLFAQELIKGFGADARAAFDTEIDVKIRKLQKEDLFDEHGVIDAVKAYENSLKQADLSQLKNQARVADSFEFAKIKASLATIEFLKARAAIGAAADKAAAAAPLISGLGAAHIAAGKGADAQEKAEAKLAGQLERASAKLGAIAEKAGSDRVSAEEKVFNALDKTFDQIGAVRADLALLAAEGVDTSEARAAAELAASASIGRANRELADLKQKLLDGEQLAKDEADEADKARSDKTDARMKASAEAATAAFQQTIGIVASFGATAFGALSELAARQQEAANDALAASLAAVDVLRAERAKLTEEMLEAESKVEAARISARLNELDAEIGAAKQTTQRRKKDARDAWKASKQLSLAEVAFNTAAAVMMAYAQFGPPPSPAGIASALAAGAAGATQAALIASQKPPQFHVGTAAAGSLGASFTRAGDVLAALDPREAVLNPRAADAVGRDNVAALNQTGSGGGAQVFALSFEGRHVDMMVARTMQSGGQTRNAISAIARTRPVGQIPVFGGR